MPIADFDSLADQIFSGQPAEAAHQMRPYMQSFGFHQFRIVLPELADVLSPRHDEHDLSAWMDDSEQLGPYERQILGDLLFAPYRLVLIVGAPGSGKSSTLRYALTFFDRKAKLSSPVARASARQSLSDLLAIGRPRHAYLDLNARVSHFEQLASQSSPVELEQHFLRELPEALSAGVFEMLGFAAAARNVSAAGAFMDVVRTAFRWAFGEERSPESFKMRGPLQSVFNEIEAIPEIGAPIELRSRITRQLSRLTADQQLRFWFGILEVISQQTQSTTTAGLEANFFLIVDNLDPYAEHLQRQLTGKLNDFAQVISFKIVVPVRYATFRTVTYTRHINWYPHSGPAPLEIVTLRLLTFLADPMHFTAYVAMSQEVRRRANCRAFELLLRLHRGHGAFRALSRLMGHAAGESARRALEGTKFLFLSTALDHQYDGVHGLEPELKILRSRYQFRLAILSLAAAMREELDGLSLRGIPLFTSIAQAHEVATTITNRCIAAARSIFTRISEPPPADEVKRVCEHEEVGTLAASDLASGARIIADAEARSNMHPGVASSFLRQLCAELVDRLPASLKVVCQLDDESILHITELLVSGLNDRVTTASRDDTESELEDVTTFDEWETSHYFRKLLSKNRPHQAARAFVNSAFMVNVFHDSARDNALTSGKLRILHWLACGNQGKAPVSALLEGLRQYKFSRQSILSFFNDLMAPRIALFWVDQGFHYKSFGELEDLGETEATLTRAGWGYYFSVLEELDYVAEVTQVKHDVYLPLIQKLTLTLKELSDLHQIDWRLFKTRISGASEPDDVRLALLRESAISISIAARLARPLISRAAGHFHRVATGPVPRSGSAHDRAEILKDELNGTRYLLVRWKLFLGSALKELLTVAQCNIEEGDELCGTPMLRSRSIPMWVHKDRVTRARLSFVPVAERSLKDALQGPRFWQAGMQRDEFSPTS